MLEKYLEPLFWQCVQTPYQNTSNVVKADFENQSFRVRIKKTRLMNFNLRIIEILKSPNCFELLKFAVLKWGDGCLLTTAIARLIVHRRKKGLYNSMYEIVS